MQEQNPPQRQSTRAYILGRIEAFLLANPTVSAEGFGWFACRQTGLVACLRRGGDTKTANLDKIIDYLANPHQSRKSYGANRKRKINKETPNVQEKENG